MDNVIKRFRMLFNIPVDFFFAAGRVITNQAAVFLFQHLFAIIFRIMENQTFNIFHKRSVGTPFFTLGVSGAGKAISRNNNPLHIGRNSFNGGLFKHFGCLLVGNHGIFSYGCLLIGY